jgi:hypothetical protein
VKCCICKKAIASGVDAQKAIVEYLQADGSTKIFGYMMPDGPLSAATGQILRAWHHKEFHVQRKREARGDAVTGRVLNGVPTAYDIGSLALSREEFEALGLTEDQAREQGTAYLSARLDKLRDLARSIGKGVGDSTVLEAFWAEEHSGPYSHTHHLPLEIYQLRAHLQYAHGASPYSEAGRVEIYALHNELHTRQALTAITAARDTDPGHTTPAEHDWREQVVVDVQELT